MCICVLPTMSLMAHNFLQGHRLRRMNTDFFFIFLGTQIHTEKHRFFSFFLFLSVSICVHFDRLSTGICVLPTMSLMAHNFLQGHRLTQMNTDFFFIFYLRSYAVRRLSRSRATYRSQERGLQSPLALVSIRWRYSTDGLAIYRVTPVKGIVWRDFRLGWRCQSYFFFATN